MLTEGCLCVCMCLCVCVCLRVSVWGGGGAWGLGNISRGRLGWKWPLCWGSSAWLSTGPFSKAVCFLREESFHLPPGVEVGGLEQRRILAAGGLKTEQPGDGALLS